MHKLFFKCIAVAAAISCLLSGCSGTNTPGQKAEEPDSSVRISDNLTDLFDEDIIQNELQREEKKSIDVKRFLAVVKKYTDLIELTPEILWKFVDRIIVHAPDKSSGRCLQEIEIIYNHIGEFDRSKVTLWKRNAV